MNFQDKLQWDFVNKTREALAENKCAFIQAATGVGKTEFIKKILSLLKDDHSLVFIAPKINNVTDAHERYEKFGATLNIGSFGISEVSRITCTTKQSIKKIDTSKFTIAVFDESHNYKEEFIESVKTKYKIFLSATPWNDNGYLWDQYQNVPKPCVTYTLKSALQDNLLCSYEIFGSKHAFNVKSYIKGKKDYTKKQLEEITSQNLHEFQANEIKQIVKAKNRKKVVIVCSSIKHAETFHNYIPESLIVHSKLKNSSEIISKFKNEDYQFCISVTMMSEGTDIKPVDCIVILRPIKSSRMMVQLVGRGLRKDTSKDYCLILDYGRTFENCGDAKNPIIPKPKRIGLPNDAEDEITIIQCEACFKIFEPKVKNRACPECGHINVSKERKPDLKKSLLDEEQTYEMICSSYNIYKNGVSRNGNKYLTLLYKGKYYTLFGYQVNKFKSMLPQVKITYQKTGKSKFKVLNIQRPSMSELENILLRKK